MFGIIAMGAAVTIYMFRRQIKQTERLANDRRQRRARAARELLPLALSEIGEDCILYALLSAQRSLRSGAGVIPADGLVFASAA